MDNLYQLRYPIGEFSVPTPYTDADLKQAINEMEIFPSLLESVIENLDSFQLSTPYRPEGWTVAQVVHHCADSHMNCLIRIKLALSEDNPTIKPYREELWAEMKDYDLPLNNSTTLLHAVHKKIVQLFNACDQKDWERTYVHPQYGKTYTLAGVLFLYAWHGKHHYAHINELRKRMNW